MPNTDPPPRPKVLSVVGPGRSGTTVLARILAEVPGAVDAGELRWEWQRGVLERRPCGCGRKQHDCPVWSQIVPRVLDVRGWSAAADLDAAARARVRWQAELNQRRHRLRLLRNATASASGWTALERIRQDRTRLCAQLAQATGASVVIDVSKGAQDAAILAGAPELDHFVLQIVRDPRGVAHSWRRVKPHPLNGMPPMATRPLPLSVERWTEICLSAEALHRYLPRERWHFLRYEDFVARPRSTVQEILDFLGHRAESPVAPDGTVVLGPSHTVAGNTDRFRSGETRIVADQEWRRGMPRREQVLVGLATAPLLRRYGYPIVPPRP